MIRWVVASVWLWSAWAAWERPAVAHARQPASHELATNAICGDGAQTFHPQELALGRTLATSAAPEQREPERSGALAGASAVVVRSEAGSSASTGAHSALASSAFSPPSDDSPPAWCISPDDPRCAPRDQGAPLQGQRAHAPVQDVSGFALPELSARSAENAWRAVRLGAPRAGVGFQIERPPRA